MEPPLSGPRKLSKSRSKDNIGSAPRPPLRFDTDSPFKKLSPPRDSTSFFREESLSSFPGADRLSTRRSGLVIGIITGESTRHFLIRLNGTWIPVFKSSLFSSKGECMTAVPFSELKNKRVKLVNSTTHSPEAFLLDDSDHGDELTLRIESEGQVDRDCETDIGLSEEEVRKALELQISLTTDLCTDVAALAALRHDHSRSIKYMKSRTPRIKKSIDGVMAAVRSFDPHLYSSVRPTCLSLFSNLDLLTSDYEMLCFACKNAAAHLSLHCGHKLCLDCANHLVSFSADREVKLQRCPSCHRELTLTDGKLIMLEKYQELKKGDKFAYESHG